MPVGGSAQRGEPVNTQIPELDRLIEETPEVTWTAEIEAALHRYYRPMAQRRKLSELTDVINKRFNRNFSADALKQHAYAIGAHREGG